MENIAEKNAKKYDTHAKEWWLAMSGNVGHKYLEKPAMEAQLPRSFSGKSVLCIGVGSGEELGEILKRNPEKVIGIDISVELLKIAQSRFPSVEFEKMEMTKLKFLNESFDFVYSSLTFHYAKDWDILLAEVNRVLKNGGELLFSTHHPEYWYHKPMTGNSYTNERGVTVTEHKALLPGNVEIIYYNHSSVDSIQDAVEYAGFKIQVFLCPTVIEMSYSDSVSSIEAEACSELKKKNDETPLFLVVEAIKQ